MKYFLFFVLFLKSDHTINPEISVGKCVYDTFGFTLGLGDDIEIGSYTYVKTEGFVQYKLKLSKNKFMIIRLGLQLELGKRNSIGLKLKAIYNICELFLAIKKNNQNIYFKCGFSFVKNFHQNYFYEISLGFHKTERSKIINKEQYISNIKKFDQQKLKKQIIHKFIWNNQALLETNFTPERLDSFLSQYIKTFNPIFNEITKINLNRILDDIFFEQKKLFNKFFKNINILSLLNHNAVMFLNKNILDFDYNYETQQEFKHEIKDYFENNGIWNQLIRRAIYYQKNTTDIFLLNPIEENKFNFIKIYEKYLNKILVSSYTTPQNQTGHMVTNQFYNNIKKTIDIQTIKNAFLTKIKYNVIPIGHSTNCVMYSYYLSIFALLKGDLEESKKILLSIYELKSTKLNFINLGFINCNPIKNQKFSEYLLKILFTNNFDENINKIISKINKTQSKKSIKKIIDMREIIAIEEAEATARIAIEEEEATSRIAIEEAKKIMKRRQFIFLSDMFPYDKEAITTQNFFQCEHSKRKFKIFQAKVGENYSNNNTQLANNDMNCILDEIRKQKTNIKLNIMNCLTVNCKSYEELIEKYPIINDLVQDLVIDNDQEIFIPILSTAENHYFALYVYKNNNKLKTIILNSSGIQGDKTSCGFIVLYIAQLASNNLLKIICEEENPMKTIKINLKDDKFGPAARANILELIKKWDIYDPKN